MSLPEARKKLERLLRLLIGLPDDCGTLGVPKTKQFSRNHRRREATRGTRDIGVTKNANRYQAMLMLRDRKRYIGTYKSAEEAARAFDKHSLWFRGLKVLDYLGTCRVEQTSCTRKEN